MKKLLFTICVLFLIIGLIGCENYNSENEIEEISKDANGEEKVYHPSISVIDSIVVGEKVYLLVEADNGTQIYYGSKNNNVDVKKIFEFNETKKFQRISVDETNDQLILKSESKLTFFDWKSKEETNEIILEGSNITSNIIFNNYYDENYFYAVKCKADNVTSVVMSSSNFEFPIELLTTPNNIVEIFMVDNLKGFGYGVKTKGSSDLSYYYHDLVTNTTERISNKYIEKIDFSIYLENFKTKTFNIDDFVVEYVVFMPKKEFDLVIKDGIVFDPEKEAIKIGFNIGIIDNIIESITNSDIKGKREIDAHGLIVSPGFIDMLSFNPNLVGAKYKIGDGVTTNLSMHGCTNNFEAFFARYERWPTLVNHGGAVFMVQIRMELGIGHFSEATKEQIEHIAMRTREEIESGALGLAFSPEYYPGTNSEEIKAAMRVASEYNIWTHFHGRHSSLVGEYTSIDTVIEVLDYARELDTPVHFMHLHSTGGTGVMKEALELIREARLDGYEVNFDIYPYDSWATNIGSARFDGDWKSKFGISYSDLQIAGTTNFVTAEDFEDHRKNQTKVIAFAMDEQEVIMAMREYYSMIGSDSIVTSDPSLNHPRASGAFARFFGRYVRDQNIMPLMEGVKKTSFLTAKQLEPISEDMKKRGRLKEGAIADITIFDYAKIIDTSSPEIPASLSEGIEFVIVSGVVIKDEKGIDTSKRHGKPIRNNFVDNGR
ncbi:MAG: amidohydrolase family protein [Alkaliphilus sp.]